ncbi:Lysyl-tRNA synthetase (class I) [hydrothermal vent metagenome]|uniref:Lysine--tRNA ligase n=1 Tax=hydrothermal vent metagenome TaxID=652676 RepID=A0A3B1CIY9_9ZZZZ
MNKIDDKTRYTQWPFIEAGRIVERIKRLGKSFVIAQTGYGPSGLPHIGTFGEVARTSFVLKALNIMEPDIDTRLISFSDDMDGLREVPKNIPNQEMAQKHLGKPLTSIPDPYGEEKSYAHYMNRRLREFLDSFGFEYEFASSTDKYKSGVFNDGLLRILGKHERIIELFTKTIGEDKRADWSPFFPICENCGKIYSTKVTGHHPQDGSISYECSVSAEGKFKSCGHKGTISVLNGSLKVGWKVDWALRWSALGVDYEMHGEDLTESARLSKKIVKEIGARAPELFKYELFLDETGRKISKKIGNGISIDQWLKYGPVDSLLYFMFLKPQQSKKMGLPLLPKIIDGYLELMAKSEETAVDSPGHFVKRLSKGAHATAAHGENIITYSLIYNLVLALAVTDHEIVRQFLIKYQPEIKDNIEYFDELIDDVITYYREYHLPGKIEEQAGREHDAALSDFLAELEKYAGSGRKLSVDEAQTLAFQAGKNHDVAMKEWFKTLYRVFLKQSSGPKIGSFVTLIGVDNAIGRLKEHLLEEVTKG